MKMQWNIHFQKEKPCKRNPDYILRFFSATPGATCHSVNNAT